MTRAGAEIARTLRPDAPFVLESSEAVEQAGLAVVTIDYPRPHDPAAWSTDEASTPP